MVVPDSCRVAHTSRVLVAAPRRNGLLFRSKYYVGSPRFPAPQPDISDKFAMARTPSPARETRALPNRQLRDFTSSPR